MPRQKNDGKGRLGGRQKGSPNKVTASLRDSIKGFLDRNWKTIETDFSDLEPAQRIALYERFLQYVTPKMSSNELKIDYENMSDEQLEEILQTLLKRLEK